MNIQFEKPTISILGCGWYGKAAGAALIAAGATVKGSATTELKKDKLTSLGIIPYVVNVGYDSEIIPPGFFECDLLIICIPPKFRAAEENAYLSKISCIIELIEAYAIKKIIYISSTGVYGDYNRVVNELDDPLPDNEKGRILFEAEQMLVCNNLFKTTVLRFAGLIGPGRDPGRFFAGKINIPNGQAPVNLIHLDDCVGITLEIITKEYFGYLFNACMPDHPDKATFYTSASLSSDLPAPVFLNEINKWKIVNSVNVVLLNYKFKIPVL